MGVNKVLLIGNMGADPEVRRTQSGQSVATLRLATNERWTDRSGAQQERTEWHRIVAWGRLAEIAEQYMKKGRQLYVEGRIQTRQWQDKEGQTRYTTEIVAQNIQMLGGRGEVDASMPSPPGGDSGRTVEPDPGGQPDYDGGGGSGGEDDSDLPF